MFTLEGNLRFIKIDLDYIKSLHDVCAEVFYRPNNYENKPYIGLLVSCDGYKYAIPLTSAKKKHLTWRDIDNDRFLIFEMADRKYLNEKDIWKADNVPGEPKVKHILSAIDLKKMIPVRDDIITQVDFNPDPKDDADTKKYKELLDKEYRFCIKIKGDILHRASRLYDKQIKTGKIAMFCCDFKKLEAIADNYST